jgi:uncharacterized protein (TIGR02453 family)
MIMGGNESFWFEAKADQLNPKVREGESLLAAFQKSLPQARPGQKCCGWNGCSSGKMKLCRKANQRAIGSGRESDLTCGTLLFPQPFLPYLCMPVYFTAELFRFLARLKRNNDRDWFLAHQQEFETSVRQPALRFITEFAAPLSEIAPHLVADPRPSRGSMFRIYRDVRFSPDKRPYKTHVAMRFSHRGKDVHSPGFYLHLEPGGCFAACGLWRPQSPTLLKVRSAILSRSEQWRAVRPLLNWDDAGKLRRPPHGFPADHEFVEDLKLRDLGTSVNFTDKQVCSPKFMSTFGGACRTMSPLAAFLSGAVGLKF